MSEYFTQEERINCRFLFECRQPWEQMDNTDIEGVRYCDKCRRDVHFADTAADLERLSREGKCIALFTKTSVPDHGREVTAGVLVPPERNVTAGIPAPPPESELPRCFECNAFFPKEGVYCARCGAARDGSRGDVRKETPPLHIAVEMPEPLEEKSWRQKISSFFGGKK